MVGEGVAHDKGWMSLPTTQVHQSPIGKQDHMTAVGEGVPVHLGGGGVGLITEGILHGNGNTITGPPDCDDEDNREEEARNREGSLAMQP